MKRNRVLGAAVVVAALLLGAWLLSRSPEPAATFGTDAGDNAGVVAASASQPKTRPNAPSANTSDAGSERLEDGGVRDLAVKLSTGWGSQPHELGRERPKEANPEAPMSFTIGPSGELIVLDQVNQRISRFDKDGKPLGTMPLTVQGAQEIALSAEGNTLVLDRLADKTVAVMGPDGALKGELPLIGKGVEEGGAVTGMFVDGDSVYVEVEHGPLVRLGDTSGVPDPERPEIPGRPTRDGKLYLKASLTDAATGRIFLAANARDTLEHRYSREINLGVQLYALLFLDTDQTGVGYLAVAAALPTGKPEAPTRDAIILLCLDPADGTPLGRTELPVSPMPEETFRDFAVVETGGVYYAHRTPEGMTVRHYDCR